MLRWRLSDEPVAEQEKDVDGNVDLEARKQVAAPAPSAPPMITASLRGSEALSNTAPPGQMYDFPWLHLEYHQQVGRDERARVFARGARRVAISLTSSAQRSERNRPFSVPAQAGRLHRQHGWRHRGGLHQVPGTDQDRCVLVRVSCAHARLMNNR
jgi:hypothetical protein